MSGSIGSVFLGDRAHQFSLLASGRPPSFTSPPTSPPPRPVTVDPIASLQLRLRWLEALVAGLKNIKDGQNGVPDRKETGQTQEASSLFSRTEDIQTKLNDLTESNETIKKFLKNYDQYAHLLTPAAALSPTGSSETPTYDSLPQEEFDALLHELEPDIRAADRDLRETDELDSRGVSAAGKLPEHDALKERLHSLVTLSQADIALYDQLEARVASILQNYASQINMISELFVSWNELIAEAEDRVVLLERQRNEEQMKTFS